MADLGATILNAIGQAGRQEAAYNNPSNTGGGGAAGKSGASTGVGSATIDPLITPGYTGGVGQSATALPTPAQINNAFNAGGPGISSSPAAGATATPVAPAGTVTTPSATSAAVSQAVSPASQANIFSQIVQAVKANPNLIAAAG